MKDNEKIKPGKIVLIVLIAVGTVIWGRNFYTAMKHYVNKYSDALSGNTTIFCTEEEMTETVRGYYPEVVLISREEYDPIIHGAPTELNAVDVRDIKYIYFFNNKGIEFNLYEGTPFWAYGPSKVDSFIGSCNYEEKLGEYLLNNMPAGLPEKFDSGIMEKRKDCEFLYRIGSSKELHDAVTAYRDLFEFMTPYLPDDPGTGKSILDVFVNFYVSCCVSGNESDMVQLSLARIDRTYEKQIDWEQCERQLYDEYMNDVSHGRIYDPYITREDAERALSDSGK